MPRIAIALGLLAAGTLACATPPASAPPSGTSREATGSEAARTAAAMIGQPYRYGGAGPDGFDCSGLVLYSYARAGLPGLPHSAEGLERLSRPVSMDRLQPGDLLFFRLSEKKTSHVAIYVGDRSFVHAPSTGRGVERVPFDHVYWSRRLARAGRIAGMR